MNNENTQLLTLDEHTVPCTEIQRFVDGLVNTYEQRILKAKVVQLDHTSRAYAPVLDLDAHESKPAEEDVLSARIFPTQDTELMREALIKELDSAVENYANAIVRHSRTAYALSVRGLYITRAVLHFIYTQAQTLSTSAYRAWRARQSERREESLLHAVLLAQKEEAQTASAPEYVNPELRAEQYIQDTAVFRDTVPEAPEVPAVLMYTYEVQHVPAKKEQVMAYPEVAPTTPLAPAHDFPKTQETATEQLRWEHVARCLYLQFRYGPADLRAHPELWD